MAKQKTTPLRTDYATAQDPIPDDTTSDSGESGEDDLQIDAGPVVLYDPHTSTLPDPRAAPLKNAEPGFWAVIKIDKRVIEVNYGTEEVFTRLLTEYAVDAFTNIPRPNNKQGRKYVRCIYCKNATLTGKTRLNRHRWDKLCPAVRDKYGNKERMLPYPDQGRGQGKSSEMIRKGKKKEAVQQVVSRAKGKAKQASVSQKGKRKAREPAMSHPDKGFQQEGDEDDDVQEVFPDATPVGGQSRTNSQTKEGGTQDTGQFVSSTATAEVQEGQSIADRTKSRKAREQKNPEKSWWNKPLPKGSKSSPVKTNKTQYSDCEDEPLIDKRRGRSTQEPQVDSETQRKSVRFMDEDPAEELQATGRKDSTSEELSFKFLVQERRTDSSLSDAQDRIERAEIGVQAGGQVPECLGAGVDEDLRLRCDTVPSGSSPVETPPSPSVPLSPPFDEMNISPDDPKWKKAAKLKSTAAKVGFLKRKSPARVIEDPIQKKQPLPKRPKAVDSPPKRRIFRNTVLSSDSEEKGAHDRSSAETLQDVGNDDAMDLEDPTDVNQTLGAQPVREEESPSTKLYKEMVSEEDMEEVLHHDDSTRPPSQADSPGGCNSPSYSPSPTPSPAKPEGLKLKAEAGLGRGALAIVPWTGSFEGNLGLQRYWMSGVGSPQLKVHQENMAKTTSQRAARLEEDERKVRSRARARADAFGRTSPRRNPPTPCPIPDMFHLVNIRPQLLPWDYAKQTAEEFRVSFREAWEKRSFQAATRECSMWWLCDAREEDYPSISSALGRAVTSVCQSVKYEQIPPDIELMAQYLQYQRDVETYQTTCTEFRQLQEKMVEDAVQQFRRDTEFRRESYRWDWCPLWWVVSQVNVFHKLPPLPWRHDDEEADEVRRILLAQRVTRMAPPPFVQVLRLTINNRFGRFRQMTCPIFGVSRSTIRALCRSHSDIMRALGLYAVEGPFRFSGLADFQPHSVQADVFRDALLVCDGKEDHVLDSIMQWVETVRVRALQDLALHHPAVFRTCWRTVSLDQWSAESNLWSTCLRAREDFDIGWVADGKQPPWATRVTSIRNQITELVQSLQTAIDEDDDAAWNTKLGDHTTSDLSSQEPLSRVLFRDVPTVSDKDRAERISHDDIPHHGAQCTGTTEESASAVEVLATVGGATEAAVEELAAGDAPAHDPVKSQIPMTQDPLGLSQEFSVSQMDSFLSVGDIHTQDLDVRDLASPHTPPTLVGLLCRDSVSGDGTVDVVRASPRTFDEVFAAISNTQDEDALEQKEDSDSDNNANEKKKQFQVSAETAALPRSVRHRKAVTFAPSPVPDNNAKTWCRISIPKAYEAFDIEGLMEALPRRGHGKVDAGTINFFGDPQWDCLPVLIDEIRALSRTKRFLGQNIVELLARRLWWSLSPAVREKVYVAPSFMQGPLEGAWDEETEEALIKWGRQFLVPIRFYNSCPADFEVLVPYVNGKHWSLFILRRSSVLHLDSAHMHHSKADLDYFRRLQLAWEFVHEPRLTLPKAKEDVKCFEQIGSYECGFCVLRFMETYLRIVHGDDVTGGRESAEATFRKQVTVPERGREMQKNVIAAVADELGVAGVSELYEPPYRVLYATDDGPGPVIIEERSRGPRAKDIMGQITRLRKGLSMKL